MHLRDFLRINALSQAAFGAKLSPPVSASKVNHWLEGRRRVSLAEGLQVAALSGGLVSLQELADMYRAEGFAAHGPSLGEVSVPVHPNEAGAVV